MNDTTAGELYWGELGRDGFIDELWKEIKRAALKHTWDQTPLSDTMSDDERFKILMEEVLETVRATTYDGSNEYEFKAELMQTVAMGACWLMYMKHEAKVLAGQADGRL